MDILLQIMVESIGFTVSTTCLQQFIASNAVVPKLGAMPPPPPPGGHGAIAGEPWAHIEKIYFSRIDTEKWTF